MPNDTIIQYGYELAKRGLSNKPTSSSSSPRAPNKKDPKRNNERRVDEASKDSFPASDAPAFNSSNPG